MLLPRSSYSIAFLLFHLLRPLLLLLLLLLLFLPSGNSMSDESSGSTLAPTPFSSAVTTTAAQCSNYSDQLNKLFKSLFDGIIDCNSSESVAFFNVSLQCRDDSYLLELTSHQPFNISAGKITCADCQDEVVLSDVHLDIRLASGTHVEPFTVGDAHAVDDNSDCSRQSINSSSVALSFSFYTTSYHNISALSITFSKEGLHSNATSWNLELFQLTENIETAKLSRNNCSDNSSPPFVEKCCKNSVKDKNDGGNDKNSKDSCPQCAAFEFPDLSLKSSESRKLIFILEVYFHLCQDRRSSNITLSIFNRTTQTVTNQFVMTQRDKNDTVPRAIVMFWDLTPQDVKYLTVSGEEAMDYVEKIVIHWIYDDDTSLPSTKSPTERMPETSDETSSTFTSTTATTSSSVSSSSSSTTSISSSSTTTASSSSIASTTTVQSTVPSLSVPTSSTTTTTTIHSEPSTSSSSSSSPSKPSSKATTTLPTTPLLSLHSSSTSTAPTTYSTSTLSSTSATSSSVTTSTTKYSTSTVPAVIVFSPDPFKLTDEEYTEELKNKNNPAYKRLRETVFSQLSAICMETIPGKFLNVTDMSFSRGSVIVNATIGISSELSADEKRKLNEAIQDRYKNSLNLVAVVVGSVVGLLFLVIVILLFILCFRQWRKGQRRGLPPGSLPDPVEPTDTAPGPYAIRRPTQLLWQSSVGTSSLTRRGGQSGALELAAREASGEGNAGYDGEKPPPPQRTDVFRGAGYGIKGPPALMQFGTSQEDERADWSGAIPRPGLDVRLGGGQAHRNDSTKAFDYPFGPAAVRRGSWEFSDPSGGAEMVSSGFSDKRVLDGRGGGGGDRSNVSYPPGDPVNSGSSPLFCDRQAFFPWQTPIFQVTSSPSPFEACLSKPVQLGAAARESPHHTCDFEGLFVPVLGADGRSEFSRNSSNRNHISHSDDELNQSNAEKSGDGDEFNWGSLHDGSSSLDDILTHYGSKRRAPANILALFQGTISRGSKPKPDNIHRAPPTSQPNKSRPQRNHEMEPDSGV